MNVAIIPARSGSKRIPRKNVRPFAGKPIIYWPIKAALDSKLFDRVIVSTDDDDIIAVSLDMGAEVPFKRPKELADDITPTAPVVEHALRMLEAEGELPAYACCIYATAPFVRPEYLKLGFETLLKYHCGSAFSVTTFPFPILRGLSIGEDGIARMIWPEYELTRSQDLEEAYHDAGQFYWFDVPRFLKELKLYSAGGRPVILPRHMVQDIDTLEDWHRAELMFKTLNLA